MFVLPVYNVANNSCMLELISFQIYIDHGFSDCVCLCTTYRVFSLSASNGRYVLLVITIGHQNIVCCLTTC